ncbi:MAG: nitroreductase family protein [Bacteroidaceae bacterium]|nr:nitroreductase family protein [Bacteroidaceae bacterium]
MNKLKIITLVCAAICLLLSTCTPKAKQTELTVSEALAARHSVRSFTNDTISNEQLMQILWAANGASRGDRRTAPSAINAQDINLYVCTAYGVSRYEAQTPTLETITDQDIRPIIMRQNKFVLSAPVTILLISNLSAFGDWLPASKSAEFGLIDAGIVSENISLYCTAVGLGTVPCAPPLDADTIRKVLSLDETQMPVMYHPIGWPDEQE